MVWAGDWNPQHRSVGINTPDTGKIIFFIIYVILGELGKKLDKGYQCPVYCEVNHKHRIIEYDTQREQGTNEETGEKLDGSDVIAGREQSESGI